MFLRVDTGVGKYLDDAVPRINVEGLYLYSTRDVNLVSNMSE